MGQVHGQRALRIAVDARFEPGGAPRARIPAVGADRKPGRDDAPVFKTRPDGVGAEIISSDPRRDPLDAWILRDRSPERLRHKVVFDVTPERVEPDFRGVKLDRTRRK